MGRYTDYVRMLVERPELANILGTARGQIEGSAAEKLSPEEETTYAYLLLGYGIFEEVYSLYKKKWMDEDTWQQWSAFLERMVKHPLFKRVHNMASGTFDRDFQEFVSKMVQDSKAST
jgi:hypothetical protein